jgi:hypothetical protein
VIGSLETLRTRMAMKLLSTSFSKTTIQIHLRTLKETRLSYIEILRRRVKSSLRVGRV